MFVLNRGIDSFIDAFFLSLLCRFCAKVSKILLFLRGVFSQKLPKKPSKGVVFPSFSTRSLFCLNFIGVIYRQMRKKVKKSSGGCCVERKRWYLCNPKRTEKWVEGRGGRLAVLWKNGMDVANSSKIFLRRSDKVGTDKKAKEII